MIPAGCNDGFPEAYFSGDLLRGIHDLAFDRCIPLQATIEITLRCNLRCLHCYNFDRDLPRSRAADATELRPEEIHQLMTALKKEGCLFLAFTGGEALSHPRLFDFLDHARSLHFCVRILSNGTLLSAGSVERLASYPNLASVELSLYGATAAVHDAVTQLPGSFARTWEGAERLRERGVGVRLKFIVMRQNVHQAESMIRGAEESQFPFAINALITGRYDGTNGSLGTRIADEDIEPLYRGPLRHLVPRKAPAAAPEDFACNCARGNCAVTSQGDVYPCIAVPYKAGNVRELPFGEIWRNSPVFARIRSLRLPDYSHCAPCPHRAWCPRDRGANLLASGDYTGVDPFICRVAETCHRIGSE
jgi:radical SAM protein with 4Fe4S-binding SPASM domain